MEVHRGIAGIICGTGLVLAADEIELFLCRWWGVVWNSDGPVEIAAAEGFTFGAFLVSTTVQLHSSLCSQLAN